MLVGKGVFTDATKSFLAFLPNFQSLSLFKTCQSIMQMLFIAPKSPSFFNVDLIFLMHTKHLHLYTSKNVCEKLGY
jgi:hypothetical protein